jgi:hypothetical protein
MLQVHFISSHPNLSPSSSYGPGQALDEAMDHNKQGKQVWASDVERRFRGCINFPGNPHFRPSVAFKMATTSRDMEDSKEMLARHALVVKEKGPLALRSGEELKEIIFHQFDIRKHEIYAYRSFPLPFIVIFLNRHARDVVFTVGRVIDGPIELRFHA